MVLLKWLYALIHPFIIYGITIWELKYLTYLNPILKLQKQFSRIITFSDLIEGGNSQWRLGIHVPPPLGNR